MVKTCFVGGRFKALPLTSFFVTHPLLMALALRRPPRLFHTTAGAYNLIGPSDPVSNLRPVIYGDAQLAPTPKLNHPYSLREFTGGAKDYDLQWKIQRQQLDSFNHAFWTDVSNGHSLNSVALGLCPCRAILVLNQPNKPSFFLYQRPPPLWIKNALYLSFTGAGCSGKTCSSETTRWNGGDGITRLSCLPQKSSCGISWLV